MTPTDAELDACAEALGAALRAAGYMLATAESCTGGGIGECVTRIAGSSAWYDRGYITYSNSAKTALLGVPETLLASHGAVSEPVARAMAQGALRHSPADIAVAVTGIAGPSGGSVDKPVGTVCFAWASADSVASETCLWSGDRHDVRRQTILHALQGVIRRVTPH